MNEILRLTVFLLSAFSCAITLRAIAGAIQRIANGSRVAFWDNISRIMFVQVLVLNFLAYATHDYKLYVAILLINLSGWYKIWYIRKNYLKTAYFKSDGLSIEEAEEFDLIPFLQKVEADESMNFADIMFIEHLASKKNLQGEYLYFKMKITLLKDVHFPFQYHPMIEKISLISGSSTMQINKEIFDLAITDVTVPEQARHNFIGQKNTVFISEFNK